MIGHPPPDPPTPDPPPPNPPPLAPPPPDPRLRYHPLVRSVAAGLRRRCGVREGDALLLAVSGGADSVALLRSIALLADRRRWRLKLAVAHIQHHLRGPAAEHDAQWVAQLAHHLHLPFHRADIHPDQTPGNLEANARQLRYPALAHLAQQHRYPLVATAHHADDQLETLLMRLLRGTGPTGLRGIAWTRPLTPTTAPTITLIRPMLASNHAQALHLLRALEQPYRQDITNHDLTRTRARLRHDVLPILRQLNPNAANMAVRLADRMTHHHHRYPPPHPTQ